MMNNCLVFHVSLFLIFNFATDQKILETYLKCETFERFYSGAKRQGMKYNEHNILLWAPLMSSIF